MTPKRLYFLMVGIIVVLGLAILGGAYGINSLLESQAHQLADLKAKNEALNEQQAALAKDKSDIAKYDSLHQIAQEIVPQDKNQAETVREIVNIANANNIALDSITFPASTLGQSTTKASSAQLHLSQLTPVKGIPGVYDLEITVSSDPKSPTTYNQFSSFLSQLENNRRTAQVSSITLNPSTDNSGLLTFTLILNEYIKP